MPAIENMSKTELILLCRGLCEELSTIVESTKACRYCKHRDEDCTPTGMECHPAWGGYRHG